MDMEKIRKYFYPRSPCGERRCTLFCRYPARCISIHALLAESDLVIMLYDSSVLIFLSTLSLRRATAEKHVQPPRQQDFYPRSPCGERRCTLFCRYPARCISIHALLAESDSAFWMALNRLLRFLSTLSLRRATNGTLRNTHKTSYFYPRSPCGERQFGKQKFNIGSPFLSTLSLRRATSLR